MYSHVAGTLSNQQSTSIGHSLATPGQPVLILHGQGPVSWRPTTVKRRQFSQSNRHSTIVTRQTECHEALPSSANDEVRRDCTFADYRNPAWYLVCRVPMAEWGLDCENCRRLTIVGLHDTGPRRLPLQYQLHWYDLTRFTSGTSNVAGGHLNSRVTVTGKSQPWQELSSTLLVHIHLIPNTQKRCKPLWHRHQGKTLRRWRFYKLA